MALHELPESILKITVDTSSTINNITKQDHSHDQAGAGKHSGKAGMPPCSSILVRLHAGYFRISLSLGSQALLWKVLSQHTNETQPIIHHLLHNLPSTTFLLIWWLSLCTLILLSFLYILRCIFYFDLVKAEFSHHVGINYLFTPWISWLLLLQSVPFLVPNTMPYQVLWWSFVIPVVLLDIKIYGQWFTTEKRFLSMVANPTSQMSVIGNLVAAWAAAQMGWKESAVCTFTLGAAHYLVVFITLYQRLSGADRLPAMLRPVFFLFVAAPSTASLAWSSISGTFDISCKMFFFLSLFLFVSLACRPALFKKSMKKYNVAWWAYSFPITFLALASVEYAQHIKGFVAPGFLMLLLSALSVLVFLGVMVSSAINVDTLLRQSDPILSSFTKK